MIWIFLNIDSYLLLKEKKTYHEYIENNSIDEISKKLNYNGLPCITDFHNSKLIHDYYFYNLYMFMFETKNKSDYTLSLVKFKRNKYRILSSHLSNEKIISDKCGWNCKTVHSNFLIINFYRNNLDNQYNEYLLAKKNNLPIVKLGVDDYGQGLNISGIIVKIYIDIKKLSYTNGMYSLKCCGFNSNISIISKQTFKI